MGICLAAPYSFMYMCVCVYIYVHTYIYIYMKLLPAYINLNFMCLPHIFSGCQDVRF